MSFDPYFRAPNPKPLEAIVCILCASTFTLLGLLALDRRRVSLGSPKAGARAVTYHADAAVIAGIVLLIAAFVFARYMLKYVSGPWRIVAEIVVLATIVALGAAAYLHRF